METPALLELLRSTYLLHDASIVQQYSAVVDDLLAGKQVGDFFSKLELPDVPSNVALVTMAGVLTKADVCKGEGSATLTRQVQAAAANPAISAIILLSENCPGGQVDGTAVLAEAIKAAAKRKPVYGAVSGMACSAAVWALSGCTKIFATSATDQIGCIGVLARMKNPAAAADSGDRIEVYSNLSPKKNAESRDMDLLRQQYLDPVAKLFQAAVTDGRGDRLKLDKEDVLQGLTYVAGDARQYGLIDGIKPFSQIVSAALAEAKTNKSMSTPTIRFQRAAAVAKATGFDVTDNGFALNETQLQLIDEALAAQTNDSTALAAAQVDVTRLTKELADAATAAKTAAEAATAQAAKDATRIKELEAMDAKSATANKGEEDKHPDAELTDKKNKYATSFDKMAIGY